MILAVKSSKEAEKCGKKVTKKKYLWCKMQFLPISLLQAVEESPYSIAYYVGTRGKLRVATKCDKCRNTWGLTKGSQLGPDSAISYQDLV